MNAKTLPEPPPRALQWLEWRAPAELAGTLAAWPLLRLAPGGDGHPVLVLPGLVASDDSTRLLRGFLREHGFDVHGWGLGRNLGPRSGVHEAMLERLDRLHESTGRKVSLLGWSLGGVYARMLAAQRPGAVRSVATLGSPFAGHPRSSRAWRLYELTSGRRAGAPDDAGDRPWAHATPGVPTTSIFSRSDGIVAWHSSVQPPGPLAESIEVHGSHAGLGVNAAVLYAVADRLAQPEGRWQPFTGRGGPLRLLYPDPYRST